MSADTVLTFAPVCRLDKKRYNGIGHLRSQRSGKEISGSAGKRVLTDPCRHRGGRVGPDQQHRLVTDHRLEAGAGHSKVVCVSRSALRCARPAALRPRLLFLAGEERFEAAGSACREPRPVLGARKSRS